MMRERLSIRRAGVLAAVAVAIGSSSCAHPGDVIAQPAARQMGAQMEEVQTAVDGGDPQAARRALRDLEREVVRLRDEGLIDPARADVILASAREVAVQLSLLPGPVASPSIPVGSSPTPTSDEGEGEEHSGEEHSEEEGEEHGNGKDKGHGKDD